MKDKKTLLTPAAPSNSAARATEDELTALLEAQGELIAEQEEKVSRLTEKLAAVLQGLPTTQAVAKGKATFNLDGKEYAVLHGVQYSHGGPLRLLTVSDIASDPDVQAALIALNSGAIREIV